MFLKILIFKILYFMKFLSALFIILVSLTMTLFSEKVLISNRCISGLMANLIKKSWTDSIVSLLRCFFVTFFLVVSHHSTTTYLLITQASLMLHFLCDLQFDSLGFFHVILCLIVKSFLLRKAHGCSPLLFEKL